MQNKHYIFIFLTCTFLGACCTPTPDNNLGYLLETTGTYTAQDSDTLQNGQQEFQGQLNYMAGHDQENAAAASDESSIQDKMVNEYQSQIKQQQLKNSSSLN